MKRLTTAEHGQIVQWAFILPEEKLGACRDLLAMGSLTSRQWVMVYEAAANAANHATDAMEAIFGHKPSLGESNAEVAIKMVGEMMTALRFEPSTSFYEDVKEIGIMITIRNKSMHKQSQILRIGNEPVGLAALERSERYVKWVRDGVEALTGITAPFHA